MDDLKEMELNNEVETGNMVEVIDSSSYDDDMIEAGSGGSLVSTLKGAGIGIAVAGAVYGIYRGGKAIKNLVSGKLTEKEIRKLEKKGYAVIPIQDQDEVEECDFREIETEDQSQEEEIQEEKKETPKRKK